MVRPGCETFVVTSSDASGASNSPQVTTRQRKPPGELTPRLVGAGVAVIVAIALGVLWWWVLGLYPTDADKRTNALLEAAKMSTGVLLGGAGIFTLYVTARRQHTQELELAQREAAHNHTVTAFEHTVADTEKSRKLAERIADSNERDAAARRVTELFAKAVEQLGSTAAAVRLGGLYALERLAQTNEDQRQTVINVICAYLRMPYDARTPRDLRRQLETGGHVAQRGDDRARTEEKQIRLAAQRILVDHIPTRGIADQPTSWGTFALDLTGAVLFELDLDGREVGPARFHDATFHGLTSFRSTVFTGPAEFNLAAFANHAMFHGAEFLDAADFYRTRFESVHRFRDSTFRSKARFDGAVFDGYTDLHRAHVTDGAQLSLKGTTLVFTPGPRSAWEVADPQFPAGWGVELTETDNKGTRFVTIGRMRAARPEPEATT